MPKHFVVDQNFVQANGLKLCVQERGPKSGQPIIFIMGFASQLTLWPDLLLNQFAKEGFRVITFDNRDIGLSDKIHNNVKVNTQLAFLKHRLGQRFQANYNLYDMASDAVGLMDALGIREAHIVGASMGGMIAQILAAKHKHRVRSLNLLMTSNNSPKQPLPNLRIIKQFLTMGQGKSSDEEAIEKTLSMWRAIQSPIYQREESMIREFITQNHKRSYRPGGVIRQLHAILATGSLHSELELISTPTVVIHGKEDPLLPIKNGKIIAKKIRGAEFVPVAGMGHDLPDELINHIADSILVNTAREAPSKHYSWHPSFA